MDNNLALSAVELVLRSELNCNASIEVFFGLDCYVSEVSIDKVSQSATQLFYREVTLSKCGVACTLPDVQKDAIKAAEE